MPRELQVINQTWIGKATTMPRRSATVFPRSMRNHRKLEAASLLAVQAGTGVLRGPARHAEQVTHELALVAWQTLSHLSQNWPRGARGFATPHALRDELRSVRPTNFPPLNVA